MIFSVSSRELDSDKDNTLYEVKDPQRMPSLFYATDNEAHPENSNLDEQTATSGRSET